jgi:hypothetical protein
VSYLVAGQASPPVHQRRWWSRFLIAAMHIAQPVERGWARYNTRFRTIEIPEALHALRRSWERRAAGALRRRKIDLWSEHGVDRERLLKRMLVFAAEQRWFVRVDPGWSPHDVRFYGDRWCKVDLTTVTENHGGGRLLTRLGLRVQGTLFNSALLVLLAYLFALAHYVDRTLGLAVLPVLALVLLRLASSRRRLSRTVAACVLHVAEELGMTLVDAPELLRPTAQRAEGASAPEVASAHVGSVAAPREAVKL